MIIVQGNIIDSKRREDPGHYLGGNHTLSRTLLSKHKIHIHCVCVCDVTQSDTANDRSALRINS